MTSVAVTGHRPEKLRIPYDHTGETAQKYLDWYRQGFLKNEANCAIIGMAPGGDTLAALAAIELGLNFFAYVPFPGFELYDSKWNDWIPIYDKILSSALAIHYTDDQYRRGVFYKRDREMVNASELLLALYKGGAGGTGYTVEYAKQMGIEVQYYLFSNGS